MPIGAMIYGILPVSLVILAFFLLFRLHRLPFSMRVADPLANHSAGRQTSVCQAGEDDWGLTLETGQAFTDSWANGPSQPPEILLSFTDNAARRTTETHEQRFT